MIQQSCFWGFIEKKSGAQRDICPPFFMVVLFTKAKMRKQPKCSSANE